MINGLDIERFRTTMAAIENDHTKGKAALRADSHWVSGTKNEISVRRFPAFTTDEPKNMGGENAAPNPMQYQPTLFEHRVLAAEKKPSRDNSSLWWPKHPLLCSDPTVVLSHRRREGYRNAPALF